MSVIVLYAMVCTVPLTLSDAKADARIITDNCSAVVKAYTYDHKQCDTVMQAFIRTTEPLSVRGYFVCQADEGKDAQTHITPAPYKPEGTRT